MDWKLLFSIMFLGGCIIWLIYLERQFFINPKKWWKQRKRNREILRREDERHERETGEAMRRDYERKKGK